VTCLCCQGDAVKFGQFKNRNRTVQRYRCTRCAKTFSDQPLAGVRVDINKASQVVSMLCEGIGIRAISRLTSLNKETVLNILETAGATCRAFMDAKHRSLSTRYVQVDEMYGFVGCKEVHTTPDDEERGDQYTFLAVDSETKLIINWLVGKRTASNAFTFIRDLKNRIACRFQLSTDGFYAYSGWQGAVFQTFRHQIDYGTEIKVFAGDAVCKGKSINPRFNPVRLQECKRTRKIGDPDMGEVNTSHVERLNLSMRLFNRRLTRLTLGYSKKLSNLRHSVALLTAFYNYCRPHNSLNGETPAMVHKLTDHKWSVKELLQQKI
jgi:transposase-like protein/IS1 family transposase